MPTISSLCPRDLLIERLVDLTVIGEPLDEQERAELRLCRYLAALSPAAEEFVQTLCEQRDQTRAPLAARAAAAALLERWTAAVNGEQQASAVASL